MEGLTPEQIEALRTNNRSIAVTSVDEKITIVSTTILKGEKI